MEINLNIFKDFPVDHTEFFNKPGIEHYQLLASLSTTFNNVNIIDIGTHRGSSALALSYNNSNVVHTFDIVNNNVITRHNIEFHQENLWDPVILDKWKPVILNSPLIFLDIDPHAGTMEYIFYEWLLTNNYQGMLVCDDIWYFKEMRDNFWYRIPSYFKKDFTEIGHWSGTGVISFNRAPTRDNWTVVTAYFNLTKQPGGLHQRPLDLYMKSANTTMSIDQNLIVYCDPESYEILKDLRPEYLKDKTKFIIIEFADIPIVQTYFDTIDESRKKRNYNADPRNTTSYYLFCISRYYLLLQSILVNPFNSTHFAWCNICIERMSWKCGMYLPDIFSESRDKFSTCYIDYQSKNWTLDLNEYYRYGRCSMCSGFFTGNVEYISKFCNLLIAKFKQMVDLGLGHADEQLFSLVYFENPEIFEFYYGDYTEMINNYCKIQDCPEKIVNTFMKSMYNNMINNPIDANNNNFKTLSCAVTRWLTDYHGSDETLINQVKFYKSYLIKNFIQV
jgi:hypothetical protein